MASGNTLCTFFPPDNEPPSSAYATIDTRNGHPVLDFDASTDESAIFTAVMPRNYAGGGLTVTLVWAATSATTGDVVWNVDLERMADADTQADDLDSDSFVGVNAATATAPGTSAGRLQYTTVTFTDGADMDSIAAGEVFRIKVMRNADDGSDTMSGDAELVAVEIKET